MTIFRDLQPAPALVPARPQVPPVASHRAVGQGRKLTTKTTNRMHTELRSSKPGRALFLVCGQSSGEFCSATKVAGPDERPGVQSTGSYATTAARPMRQIDTGARDLCSSPATLRHRSRQTLTQAASVCQRRRRQTRTASSLGHVWVRRHPASAKCTSTKARVSSSPGLPLRRRGEREPRRGERQPRRGETLAPGLGRNQRMPAEFLSAAGCGRFACALGTLSLSQGKWPLSLRCLGSRRDAISTRDGEACGRWRMATTLVTASMAARQLWPGLAAAFWPASCRFACSGDWLICFLCPPAVSRDELSAEEGGGQAGAGSRVERAR